MAGLRPPLPLRGFHGPAQPTRRGDGAAGPDRVIVQPAEDLAAGELHHRTGRHPEDPESARSGRYLSLLERQRIATLRDRGLGVREIARRLDRSASTISRELRRHQRPHDRGIYDGDLAHARAREGLRRPRRPPLAREPLLRQIVQDKLREEWSPAQIAAHLRETYPDRPAWHVCHETIYQALYHGGKGGPSRTLRFSHQL